MLERRIPNMIVVGIGAQPEAARESQSRRTYDLGLRALWQDELGKAQ